MLNALKMINIGKLKLSVKEVEAVVKRGEKVQLDGAALNKVEESHDFLKKFSKEKLIYGINTGFGPMAQYKVNEENLLELQYNLIRSHCTGMGDLIPDEKVIAAMICRLNSLMQGHSGIHPSVVHLLVKLINEKVHPLIYAHGGVGASGDLVQLAHLALCLIGEGKVRYKGEIRPTKEVYDALGIEPITIKLREGLALINGTSVMTGIGLVNVMETEKLINWGIAASTMIIEMVESYDDHYSQELNQVKPHRGQQEVAKAMNKQTKGSGLIRKREEHLFNNEVTKEDVFKDKVQEYYSIRCIPQIVGPIYDAYTQAMATVESELNSVNDNPVIDAANNNIWHGGNFHGDYVSYEMDKLKMGITRLSMLSERQLNFLMNEKLNGILPPFANLGTLGLNLGMQAAQFTATSTTAENQTLSNPMYVHSISCNNDNQDIVSMGTNSALICNTIIENTYQVLAIELLTIVQSVDCLKCDSKLAPASKEIYDSIRAIVPSFKEDEIMHEKLQDVLTYIKQNAPKII